MSHLFDIISCHAGLHFCLIGDVSIVFKYNCVEFCDDTRIWILASLNVPLGIIIAFEGLNYFLRTVQHLEYSSGAVGGLLLVECLWLWALCCSCGCWVNKLFLSFLVRYV